MHAGRLVAIVISFVVLLGGGYAAWKLDHDRRMYRQRAREAALRDGLFQMRTAIARFREENARYPRTLDELVPKYLRRIPVDPVTGSSTTWRTTVEEQVEPSADFTTASGRRESYVIDVHSGAAKPYSDW